MTRDTFAINHSVTKSNFTVISYFQITKAVDDPPGAFPFVGPDHGAVVDEQPGGVDGAVAVLDGVREERPAGRVHVIDVGRSGLQEEEGQGVIARFLDCMCLALRA